jgi:DNA-binding transcriptional LysR family regulator
MLLGKEPMPHIRPAGRQDAELEWIAGLPGSPSRRLLEQWAAAGKQLSIRYETEDPHTVVSLAAEGLGQGIVPLSVLQHRPGLPVEQGQLRISGRPLTRQVLAVSRRRYTHPLTEPLCSSIQDALAARL